MNCINVCDDLRMAENEEPEVSAKYMGFCLGVLKYASISGYIIFKYPKRTELNNYKE